MKNRIPILLLAGFLAAAVTSCHGDDFVEDPTPDSPESFLKIAEAFRDGKPYLDTKVIASFSKVFFADGSSIIVPKEEWTIDDCMDKASQEVTYDRGSGRWKVGEALTDLERVNGDIFSALPVYAWRDIKYLKVYASNGDSLVFDNGYAPPQEDTTQVDPPEPVDNNLFDDNLHQKEIPAAYRIPEVYIFTEGGASIDSKDKYVNATFRFVDPSKFWSDRYEIEATGRIRGRGNTTWGMPKKPYRVKLDEKTEPFGLYGNKDWIDEYKSAFSNATIDFLCRQLRREDLSDKTLLQAANTIFQHDFLNEDALQAKVRILCKENKPGLAKTIYDNFCKEYRKSLGVDYTVPFKKLMEG